MPPMWFRRRSLADLGGSRLIRSGAGRRELPDRHQQAAARRAARRRRRRCYRGGGAAGVGWPSRSAGSTSRGDPARSLPLPRDASFASGRPGRISIRHDRGGLRESRFRDRSLTPARSGRCRSPRDGGQIARSGGTQFVPAISDPRSTSATGPTCHAPRPLQRNRSRRLPPTTQGRECEPGEARSSASTRSVPRARYVREVLERLEYRSRTPTTWGSPAGGRTRAVRAADEPRDRVGALPLLCGHVWRMGAAVERDGPGFRALWSVVVRGDRRVAQVLTLWDRPGPRTPSDGGS